jgi:hypothetical protein
VRPATSFSNVIVVPFSLVFLLVKVLIFVLLLAMLPFYAAGWTLSHQFLLSSRNLLEVFVYLLLFRSPYEYLFIQLCCISQTPKSETMKTPRN